jgi:hypothetical protein
MRDSFYHWFVSAILFAMCLGAEILRAMQGRADKVLLVLYALCGIGASIGAISEYKQKGSSN